MGPAGERDLVIADVSADGESWFDVLLAPRGVAVIGASDDLRRPGGRVVAALQTHGFRGAIRPINPKRDLIQGLRCHSSVTEVAGEVDVAVIVVAAAQVLDAVEDCAAAGVKVVVIGSAGFSEVGAAGEALQHALSERVAELGIRVIGPNTNGVVACASRFTGTFTPALEQEGLVLGDGPAAIVSQSGALGAALFSMAHNGGLPVGAMLNTGNEADVSFEEVLEELVEREPPMSVVLGYLEGIRDVDRLLSVARTAQRAGCSVVLLKVGTSEAGARAAEAHTAKLAVEDRVFDGVMSQLGFARALTLTQLRDLGRVAAAFRGSVGRRLTIASLSGGAGILLADAAEAAGLELAVWDEPWQRRLAEWLPPYLGKANPIDLAGGPFFDMERLRSIVRTMDDNPTSDVTIIAVANFDARYEPICEALIDATRSLTKPLVVVWIGGPGHAARMLNAGGVPCFPDPAACIDALAPLALRRPESIVTAVPSRPQPAAEADDLLRGAGPEGGPLAADVASRLLSLFGIPTVEELVVDPSRPEQLDAAPLPAVAKLVSRELAHKSDVGAVRLGLDTREELEDAVAELSALAGDLGLRDADVVVQREIEHGVELLLGMKRDPVFGPVLTLGMGGVLAEAFDDVVVRLPSIDAADVSAMLDGLRHQKLLTGFRGLPVVDVERIAPCVCSFARLVRDVGDRIVAIDLNPIVVPSIGSPVAVDVLIVAAAPERSA